MAEFQKRIVYTEGWVEGMERGQLVFSAFGLENGKDTLKARQSRHENPSLSHF